ncbi:hypothetical protein SprV_0200531300 [Sparganum proliferum]
MDRRTSSGRHHRSCIVSAARTQQDSPPNELLPAIGRPSVLELLVQSFVDRESLHVVDTIIGRMLLGLCLSMHTPLILWFLLLPCIAAWRLHPPDKTLVLPCPVALEKTTGSVSWFRDGQRSLFNTSESSSLVIKDPWYTESGNYTCCYAFSNWTGNADCFSSYIVFADKTELPPNLLRDTLPQPGETLIFKGITYWQPALLLSFRPANFFKRTNFSGVHFRIREEVVSHDRRHCLVNALDNRTALAPAGPGCIAHNISTEELPCPSELLDGLHGIYEEDDFYGIRNRCFRSVLTLNYRALGQDGEYVCQVTAQEGVDVEMPIRFHFPLGYPLERLVHPRPKQDQAPTPMVNLAIVARISLWHLKIGKSLPLSLASKLRNT